MKLMLICLICLGCTGAGFTKTYGLYGHLCQIRMSREFLQRLRTEILYSQVPLDQAVTRIADPTSGMFDEFCDAFQQGLQTRAWDSFSQLWDSCCDQTIKEPELKDVWMRLGRQLGHGSIPQQKQAMDHCDQELDRLEVRALEILHLRGRMYVTTGLCFGAFISVLLI